MNPSKPKLLLTGGSGQLGKEIRKILNKSFKISAPSRNELNLEEIKEIYRYCIISKPDILILAGAYTDVDKAEEEKEKVLKINFLSTKEFVRYAKKKDKLLIFISTDYVFDGKKEYYSEIDLPNPLCFYGRTKHMAEKEIIRSLKKYFIIRTSWLYGDGKNNFVYKFLKGAQKRSEVEVVSDRYGSPTYTKDVAIAIKFLLKSRNYGIYHIVNTGRVNRLEFAKEIIKIKKIKLKLIPVKAKEFGENAKRPYSSALRNEKFSLIFYPLRDWKTALREFLKEMESEN